MPNVATPKRKVTLTIRPSQAQRDLIERAAALAGSKVSTFVLGAAHARAVAELDGSWTLRDDDTDSLACAGSDALDRLRAVEPPWAAGEGTD